MAISGYRREVGHKEVVILLHNFNPFPNLNLTNIEMGEW